MAFFFDFCSNTHFEMSLICSQSAWFSNPVMLVLIVTSISLTTLNLRVSSVKRGRESYLPATTYSLTLGIKWINWLSQMPCKCWGLRKYSMTLHEGVEDWKLVWQLFCCYIRSNMPAPQLFAELGKIHACCFALKQIWATALRYKLRS